MNMGLLDTVQASLLTITEPLKRAETLQGLKTVLMESEMGEVFKVMLLTKHLPPVTRARLESAAFEAGDRRDSLML
jgi:SAM-dependent MidA family methyltransferase